MEPQGEGIQLNIIQCKGKGRVNGEIWGGEDGCLGEKNYTYGEHRTWTVHMFLLEFHVSV